MALSVDLKAFNGPLDLLLHLIEKNKVDIFDIPIVEITDQYMEYVKAMDREDLSLTSEFLVMAATLLDIKCRMLLPREIKEDGEEEDPREELVQKLLEYKMCKYMSQELRDKMGDANRVCYKVPTIPQEVQQYKEPVDPKELLAGMTIDRLNEIFRQVLRRQEDKRDPIRGSFGRIEKEEISLKEQLGRMRDYSKEHRQYSFRMLLQRHHTRTGMVVAFLSVLELIKLGYIHVSQPTREDDIEISVTADPDTWTGLSENEETEGEL